MSNLINEQIQNALKDGKCGFCQTKMIADGPFIKCPKDHMRAWYQEGGNWNGCRIWPSNNNTFCSLLLKDDDPSIEISSIKGYICIPKFNVFQYSYQEFWEKVKLYVLCI